MMLVRWRVAYWRGLVRFSCSWAYNLVGSPIDDNHNMMRVVLQPYKPGLVCSHQTIAHDIQEPCQTLLDAIAIGDARIRFRFTEDFQMNIG